MNEPRCVPIHRSLNRPNLLMGADRELVLMLLLLSVIVGFTASSWIQFVIAVLMWVFIHMALIMIARSDPYMRDVYIRHMRYKPYYAAKSGLGAPSTMKDWKD